MGENTSIAWLTKEGHHTDTVACDFLMSKGFYLDLRYYNWTRDEEPDSTELDAMRYLKDEWKYGDYRKPWDSPMGLGWPMAACCTPLPGLHIGSKGAVYDDVKL
jgi:hypothetical protein